MRILARPCYLMSPYELDCPHGAEDEGLLVGTAVGWARLGALAKCESNFQGGKTGETKKWTRPRAGPKIHDLSRGSLCLRRWFRLKFCGFLRLLLRGELLLDL